MGCGALQGDRCAENTAPYIHHTEVQYDYITSTGAALQVDVSDQRRSSL